MKSRDQKHRRRKRNERAWIFEPDVSRCFGPVDGGCWEVAISVHGGNVARAARLCGIDGVPDGAKALWGKSQEEAYSTYRWWLKRKKAKARR